LSNLAAELNLPTPVYNWLADFFSSHSHHTMFNCSICNQIVTWLIEIINIHTYFSWDVSCTRSITASIIQSLSIGPAAYIVTAADLKPVNPENTFIKFADDTYLVIPAVNRVLRLITLQLGQRRIISNWAYLNPRKSFSMTAGEDTWKPFLYHCPISPGKACSSFSASHSATTYPHQTTSATSSARAHRFCMVYEYCCTMGCPTFLQEVFRAVMVSKLTYASVAWGVFVTVTDIQRVDTFLCRSNHWSYCLPDLSVFGDQLVECDDRRLNRICRNPQYVLYSLLPPPSLQPW